MEGIDQLKSRLFQLERSLSYIIQQIVSYKEFSGLNTPEAVGREVQKARDGLRKILREELHYKGMF